MFNQSYKKLYKIAVLGDAQVGKTSLLQRYVQGVYEESYISKLNLPNDWVGPVYLGIKLQFCDAANPAGKFSVIASDYTYRGAGAYIIVFDIHDRESFLRIKTYWMKNLDRYLNNEPVILVGAKSDYETENDISEEEARELADNLSSHYGKNVTYFDKTSAKNNRNIVELMDYITCLLEPSVNSMLNETNFLLEVPVPAHIKENIPKELDKQVNNMLGYLETRPHISLGHLSVNMRDAELREELLQGLTAVLQKSPLPARILLDSPQHLANASYFGMPVRSSSEEKLKAIYDDVVILIDKLQQKYGQQKIAMQKWNNFHAHVSLYGQLMAPLQLPEAKPTEFIPTKVQLRSNDTVAHVWSEGYDDFLAEANTMFEKGKASLNLFAKGELAQGEFNAINQNIALAEQYFKNCEEPLKRVECLYCLGVLSSIMFRRTYNTSKLPLSTFYAQEEKAYQKANHRIRAVSYALATAQALDFIEPDAFLTHGELLKNIQHFLIENKKFLDGLKKVSKELLQHGIDYDSALSTLDAAIEKVNPAMTSNCSIM